MFYSFLILLICLPITLMKFVIAHVLIMYLSSSSMCKISQISSAILTQWSWITFRFQFMPRRYLFSFASWRIIFPDIIKQVELIFCRTWNKLCYILLTFRVSSQIFAVIPTCLPISNLAVLTSLYSWHSRYNMAWESSFPGHVHLVLMLSVSEYSYVALNLGDYMWSFHWIDFSMSLFCISISESMPRFLSVSFNLIPKFFHVLFIIYFSCNTVWMF